MVLAYEDYDCLIHPEGNLVEFFPNTPMVGVELERVMNLTDMGRQINEILSVWIANVS